MNYSLESNQNSAQSGPPLFAAPPQKRSENGTNDLQFMTSVDTSVQQNVPIPPVPTTAAPQLYGDMNSTAPIESTFIQFFKNSAHPIPCFFHLCFKSAAILLYVFGGLASNFITVTVVCILLLAADFWVVKNITGRLLVGLRWWCQVEGEDGSQQRWIFESNPDANPNGFDNWIFWTVTYVTPAIWSFLFVLGILKMEFGWLITVAFGVALSGANTYGYWMCSKDQKAKFQQMVTKGAEMGAASAIKNNMFGKMAGFASRFGTSQDPGGNGANSLGHEQVYV